MSHFYFCWPAGTDAPLAVSTGGSTLADLLQALEDYLPVLLGLVKDGITHWIHD